MSFVVDTPYLMTQTDTCCKESDAAVADILGDCVPTFLFSPKDRSRAHLRPLSAAFELEDSTVPGNDARYDAPIP